jgi:surface protein
MTTLNDLTDVTIASPANGERLVYEDGVWVNKVVAPPEPEPWMRPEDWLAIDEVGEDEQKFIGLMAITDDDSNFAAFTAAGDYTVDWGDGVVENYTSGATALHLYNYSAISNDTLSTRGYKQVIVTVTPQSGQNLTALNLNVKHTQSGLNAYETGWLDIEVGSPNFSTSGLLIGGSSETVRKRWVERVRVANLGGQTSCASLFQNLRVLQSVPLFDTSSVTNMSSMFSSCGSLQSVPLFDTSSVTDMNGMFSGCGSLQSVPLFDTSSVVFTPSMFSSCVSLQSVPLFNTGSVTSMNSMFSSCVSLQSVPLFNTGSVTSMNSMFSNCNSLQSVPALNTTAVTSSTNFSNMFQNCNSLSRIQAKDFRWTFSVANAKLSATALEEIYANLPRVTSSQTITVTGNWGLGSNTSKASLSLTEGDTTISVADTSGILTGMFVSGTGTGITTGVSVTSDVTADTLTRTAHGLSNGDRVAFSAISTTTGVLTWTIYFVVNKTDNDFQIALTPGGDPIDLTGSNATMTLRYPSYVTAVDPNVSVTISTPIASTGTQTLTFRELDSSTALLKNWAVTF